MTQEDKQLLLADLCARLPYEVILVAPNGKTTYQTDGNTAAELLVEEGWKPYLRPMSSMTEEERKEYYETMDKYTHRLYPNSADFSEHTEYSWTTETFDFLNANHFDYRGLIEKGLAIAVTKENNPYEN